MKPAAWMLVLALCMAVTGLVAGTLGGGIIAPGARASAVVGSEAARPSSQAGGSPAGPRVAPPVIAAPRDMRSRIQAQIDREVTPLDGEVEIVAYLDELEHRARRRGQVTALEVEPGVEAIHRLAGDVPAERIDALRAAFSTRMATLSRDLERRPEQGAPSFPGMEPR